MQSQTTFTSVQSGNYSDPTTWGTTTAPTSDDHVVISSGNTVTLDDILTAQNVTISGTLNCIEAASEFTVEGNLTVNSGGLFKGHFYFETSWGGYDKGIQLAVAGNIINNGRIDLSIGATYIPEGVLKLNGSTVQTVSGLGTFGGTLYLTDNTNTGAVINQLEIDNSSTATPNVIWSFNNIKIKGVLTLTNARVDLGTNKMTIGNYSTATTNCSAGNGFLNGTIGKWYGVYDTYAQINPGVDYYNTSTLFPFINSNGENRSAFITRPNDTNNTATAGELSVTYFDGTGITTGLAIADGSYTVTDVFEGAWSIAKDNTYAFPLENHTIAFAIENAYLIKNGNSRIFKVDETTAGNHQTGTTTPFAARTGLSTADLNNTFQVGFNASLDSPITSVQTGNWNDATTWSNNAIPSCADTVTILSGHTITVNTTGSVAGVNISSGASLLHTSSTLTVGCTNNNATFSNKGTYTISAGTLAVNGNVVHSAGSTFNQSGGDIIVDGNNNGDAATSIDQTHFRISTSSLNLTGGKITIVDPGVVNANLVTSHNITSIVPCVGWFCWYPTNIILDSVENISVGQIIVGSGIPAGTTVVNVNSFDNSINTNPSLPETGLTLPLNVSFYSISGSAVSSFVYNGTTDVAASGSHTLQIGDGISTQKSILTTTGFNLNLRAAEGVLSLNNFIVNALDTTNRFVTLDSNNENSNQVVLHIQNDFTITQGKVKGSGVNTYYGGNVVNNGELNLNNTTHFGNYSAGSLVATSNPQTISGTGTFNAQVETSLNTPSNTASVSQLRVNNSSAEGVTFMVPFNVASSLTMEDGIIHTSSTSRLKIGVPSMQYTGSIMGNFGDNCYIDGPMSKDIGGSQNADNITNGSGFDTPFFFPVGKSSYTPIWVGVTTPSGGFGTPGTNLNVEAFETNPGTASATISNLSQNRWEVSKTAGTATNFNIRVADPNALEGGIIVQAASATGVYNTDFGITATFETGTPNTLQSDTEPIDFADFKGFFSTARQADCSVVTPGNTVASVTTTCNGKSVTLSLQNVVIGEGITYQWQSSLNGTDFTDIDGETATTTSVMPLENTHYRCNVTCSFSSSTVASTPILIELNNTITATVPATICLLNTDTATLEATASSGDVKWYSAQVNGTTLGTGSPFTTPALTETTTFYAGTETTSNGTAGIVYAGSGSGGGSTNRGLAFNLNNSIILNSVKVHPVQTPGNAAAPITIKIFQNGVQVPGTSEVVFTPATFSSWGSPTVTDQTIVTLNYQLAAGDNYTLLVTDGITYSNALATSSLFPNPYPITTGAVSILGGYQDDAIDTYYYNYFYDWNITEVCSSARVAVVATVETTDCDLSNPSISDNLTKVIAYPNPYANGFNLDIASNNSSDISVKVYDMLGRLIENKEVNFDNLKTTTFGNGYPTGVYNVIVTQENHSKTLRVVKQ
ncbi:beta strand repeat-containing protein [Flavobacterium solisilvae]|uniref:T9SS type A sorting domain-containing protein n=1 Tax=Flavobacterium solisilvae TaxID=1852019 RepID=A0ABX1QTV9_9FLAO|nr:T9SS type A sorting domain-containing protein [Flavobacterium solisilvae]NMH25301.1 T9SS type A sorting domain-containing protein [Flavobacterium solisilvae]